MALPVSPPPRSDDVAILAWSGLTVRITWTLLSLGVKVRPRVLRDARAHVLFQLDRHTKPTDAEDLAEVLTRQFVRRAKGLGPRTPWDQDQQMPVSPRWRRALERAQDPLSEVIFKVHYGDNRPLREVAARTGADNLMLETARAGLREVVRVSARGDGVPLDGWPPERVDKLLERLAAWSPGPCPPLLDVVEGGHRSHAATCARCDRTVRLVRANKLCVDDLVPPSLRARPEGRAQVLALHFHPDGRHFRAGIREELDIASFPVGEDLLLVDGAKLPEVAKVLQIAAELGQPGRDLIRGAMVEGEGRWSPFGILGPLAERAEQEIRYRKWGHIDGLKPLPEALPPPPSATAAWAATAALAVSCLVLLQFAWSPLLARTHSAVSAEFTSGRGGVWTSFDVPEHALVHVVHTNPEHELELAHTTTLPSDKATWAVGDGSYRLFTPGPHVMLISTDGHLVLDDLMSQATADGHDLEWLANEIRLRDGRAQVRTYTP